MARAVDRHALPGDADAVRAPGGPAPQSVRSPTVPRQTASPGRQSRRHRHGPRRRQSKDRFPSESRSCLRQPRPADNRRRSRTTQSASARPNAAPAARPAGRAGRGAAVRPRWRSPRAPPSPRRSGTIGAKPSGYSSAMKAVDIRPSRQRGCCISAARNGMLCSMPSTTKLSSASDMASIAVEPRRRPGAQLGDHRIVEHRDFRALGHAGIVADDACRRTVPPAGGRYRVSRPIDGRKLRYGSSA